eukprot:gene941-19355_t
MRSPLGPGARPRLHAGPLPRGAPRFAQDPGAPGEEGDTDDDDSDVGMGVVFVNAQSTRPRQKARRRRSGKREREGWSPRRAPAAAAGASRRAFARPRAFPNLRRGPDFEAGRRAAPAPLPSHLMLLKEVKGAAQRCGVGAFVCARAPKRAPRLDARPVSCLDDVKRVSKGQTSLKLQFKASEEEGGGEEGGGAVVKAGSVMLRAVVPAAGGALAAGGGGNSVTHNVNFTASDLRNNKDYHYSPVFELSKYCFRFSYKLCSKNDFCGVWWAPHAGAAAGPPL